MTDQFTTPERFRHELLDALVAHAARSAAPHSVPLTDRRAGQPRARGHVNVRGLVPALALAATVAAAVLILRSGVVLRPQPATAASVLNASAAALGRDGGSRALGPGEYFYTKSAVWWRYAGFSSHPYVVRSIQEDWVARDGRGRSRYHVVALSGRRVHRGLPLTRCEDTHRQQSQARPFIVSAVPEILFSYPQLRELPSDPTRLAAAIDRLAKHYRVDRLFPQPEIRTAIRFAILRGLADTPTSAQLRAALYRLLATTPGIRLLGRTRDSIGRSGLALAVNVQDAELEMIIDPTTGQLLQTSRTLLHRSKAYLNGNQPPGLINRDTYLATGIVSSTDARAG